MAIDLSALEDALIDAPAIALPSPNGEPLQITLDKIDEDPRQPRKEFTVEAMNEMTASIRVTGVKSPVSVRQHPTKKGRWMLNYGARRFRASQEAGLKTIPAFVDEQHDSYDQVMENLIREDLSPMELALFIKSKLAEGESQRGIAKKLGKPAIMVTEHLSLIDAPACIEDAYTRGKARSPKTLHELRKLYEKYPEPVETWCNAREEITRGGVSELGESLKNGKKGIEKLEAIEGSKSVSHDLHSEGGGETGKDSQNVERLPFHNPEHEKANAAPKSDDPNKIKKPVLLVEYEGRAAMVLLHRRPSTPGLIHVKHEDDGAEVELDAGRCKINCLVESTG